MLWIGWAPSCPDCSVDTAMAEVAKVGASTQDVSVCRPLQMVTTPFTIIAFRARAIHGWVSQVCWSRAEDVRGI